jgi:uncharacterized phage-associated protein/plasmid maintenance system antidote protein VapI
MGILRSTLSQIENSERKIYSEELIALSEIFGVSVDYLLDLEKEVEISVIEKEKKQKEKPTIRISIPQQNLNKFKEVLIYILNKVGSKPNVGQTLIYKLLYFIDFDFYEKYEEQLIGATYKKNKYGPTPIEFNKLVRNMIDSKEIVKITGEYFEYPQTKYLPLRPANLSTLKAHEKEVIDSVLNRLSDMTAKEISDYSHNDVPWITTEDGEFIDYESVFYRTDPYSVRHYEPDI